MPEFYMTFARKINKISEFYMICARKNNKMPEFYMIFARKYFPDFLEGEGPAPRLLRLCLWWSLAPEPQPTELTSIISYRSPVRAK